MSVNVGDETLLLEWRVPERGSAAHLLQPHSRRAQCGVESARWRSVPGVDFCFYCRTEQPHPSETRLQ